jgi:hypothetical protein
VVGGDKMTEGEIIQLYEDILNKKVKRFFNFWNQEDSNYRGAILLKYIAKKFKIKDEDLNYTLTGIYLKSKGLDSMIRLLNIEDVFKIAFPHVKWIAMKDTDKYRKRHSDTIKNLSDEKWDRIKFGMRNNRYTEEYGKKLSETKQGELNHSAVLKEKDIPEIRKLFDTGNYSTTVIGEIYGVKRQTIRDVITRRTWKHVK